MKKLFICVLTSLCSTFAFADADNFVVNGVSIPSGGTKTMSVEINNPAFTAFQFDLTLPEGITVAENGVSWGSEPAETRKLESASYTVNKSNTWRFLSYDENNNTFAAGTTLNITLAAADGATGGEAETAEIVLVTPDGNAIDLDEGPSVTITVQNGISVDFTSSTNLTLVSDVDLDFSEVEGLKAYIGTGWNKATKRLTLTRVKDVPAGTPILLTGSKETTYNIPSTTSHTYYPENFFKGNATGTAAINNDGSVANYMMKDGSFVTIPSTATEFPMGKCYLEVPASIPTNEGDGLTITMNYKLQSYTGKNDLDFTNVDGLKAYIVTGYEKNRKSIQLTRVMKVSAGTPLLLMGSVGVPYEVPSVAVQCSYVNMLLGNATSSTAVTANAGYTNYIVTEGAFKKVDVSFDLPAGFSYLPIPTSYIAAVRGQGISMLNLAEAEVITMQIGSTAGEDDGTTGIHSIDEGQFSNDVWYNLNGQRIDTPTKKGLYIKNGKKVLVK